MFICKRFCSFITANDIIQTSFSICVTYKLQSMNYFAFSVKDRFLVFFGLLLKHLKILRP